MLQAEQNITQKYAKTTESDPYSDNPTLPAVVGS